MSIPRLELTAAVLSAKCGKFIKKEPKLEYTHETFWTDSKVVLGYIQNNTKRFKIFVANRIRQIHESCRVEQWRYVSSKLNPADHVPRGLGIANVERQTSTWIHGTKFLWQKENTWPKQDSYDICEEDPEVKHTFNINLTSSRTTTLDRLERISSWSKTKRVVPIILRFKDVLLDITKSNKINTTGQLVDMNLLQRSESSIIKMYQQSCFQNEISRLLDGKCVSKKSNIFKLDPFLDDHEIIRVGGRIRQSRIEYKLKHPILLPKNGHITSGIIGFYHRKVRHGERGMTMNEIRSNGFWVISCTAAVKSMILKCVDCRKLRGKTCQQKMSDLPEERLMKNHLLATVV